MHTHFAADEQLKPTNMQAEFSDHVAATSLSLNVVAFTSPQSWQQDPAATIPAPTHGAVAFCPIHGITCTDAEAVCPSAAAAAFTQLLVTTRPHQSMAGWHGDRGGL